MDLSGMPGGDAATAQLFKDPITVVVSGSAMYMRFPALSSLLGAAAGGKEWIKIDAGALNKGVGDILGSGSNALGTDPAQLLQLLEGAGKVTEAGKEDVDGSATTHFTGSYSMNDVIDALPDDKADHWRSAMSDLSLGDQIADQQIPFDVWVDADGLVRQITMQLDFTGVKGAGSGSGTVTMKFSDYGEAVDIGVPSDDDAFDLSEILGATSSSFSSVGSSIN
jgi:hypothetical protein